MNPTLPVDPARGASRGAPTTPVPLTDPSRPVRPAGHARLDLDVDACTGCVVCARQCPTWCIHLDTHTRSEPDPTGRRPRTVTVLDGLSIDWGLCMMCGICIDVCPHDALAWVDDPEPTAADRASLTVRWAPGEGER